MDLVGKLLPAVISPQYCLCLTATKDAAVPAVGQQSRAVGLKAGLVQHWVPVLCCSVITAGSAVTAGGELSAGCVRSVGQPVRVSCPSIGCRCAR